MGRKAKRILIILCLVFLVYNLLWLTVVGAIYAPLITGMKEVHPLRTYAIDELEGYTYNVKIPDYLQFVGNLGVQPSCGGECALIIWPGILGETRYGVLIPVGGGGLQGVRVNANGQPLPGAEEEKRLLIEQNRDAIDELFRRAREVWDY